MTLHPAGVDVGGVWRRSWLRFHGRLPVLALPDEACGAATVELDAWPGDWWCRVSESVDRRGRRVRVTLAVDVTEVPDGGGPARLAGPVAADAPPLVRLVGVGGPVLLHAQLRGPGRTAGRGGSDAASPMVGGAAVGRFLGHLDALEADGVELAAIRPGFWGHVAAAAEAGHALPWPGDSGGW